MSNLTRLFRKLTPPRLLAVVRHPDPRLLEKSAPVDLDAEVDLDLLVRDMVATMRKADGAGLAAVQVGVAKRLFVYDDSEDASNPRVLINPEIVSAGAERASHDEGCLSFPGLYRPVERPAQVTVRGLDLDGTPLEFDADDLLARICQHEVDHLDGITFVARLTPAERKAALREFFELPADGETGSGSL